MAASTGGQARKNFIQRNMTRSVGGRSANEKDIGPVARTNSHQPDQRVRGSSNENKRGNSNE